MWNEEGFKGYMRGNGINCLRIVPYSAVQFTTYEQLKKVSQPLTVYLLVNHADSFLLETARRNSIP
jgi:hypothetical protein